jgi:DNA-binding CsgD family transcriptional regulator
MHWNSTSLSASARGASASTQARAASAVSALVPTQYGVGFDITDVALEQVLRGIVAGRHDLYEAEAEEANVVISDRPAGEADFASNIRVLRVGAEQAGRNVLDTLDPGLILAAATLLAAGYALDRERESTRDPSAPLPHLSARERQVAELLVDGASNKVVARALDISVHTAKFHVTAILEKLSARNRADAVAIILREGLVAI